MASRSPAQIEAQKAAALARAKSELSGASQTASIESTPPGYITGFKIVLTPEYKIDIYPGVLNVGGLRVELGAKYTLRPEDEMMARLSRSWWYLYVDKLGAFYADVIPPEFKPEWMAYYHKNHPWRNIGRYFVCDDHLCRYASNWQQASEQTVYVAPANFGGIANYYCTGVDDQILINAAIRYLHEAYDGGECNLIRGTYHITSSILVQYDNITVAGETNGGSVVSSTTTTTNDYSIDIFGTVKNININGIKFSYSGALPLEYAIGSDSTISKLRVENIIVTGSHCGFYLSAEETIVSNCLIDNISITSGNAVGIAVGGTNTILSNNIVKTLATSDATGYSYGIAVSDQAIVTGNIVASVSNSADATRSYALMVTGTAKNNIVTGNHIQNNSKYGIYIDSGVESVSLSGNYCYNNGSDTGIANTNSNNFYDAGTDTQVYSNSWQQPVAGEPSLGTPHKNATPINLFTTATAITATTTPITLTSTQYPVGTNMIYVSGAIINAPPTNNVQIQDVASNIWTIARNYSTAITWLNGLVSISSTMGFKVVCSTGVSLCLRLTGMAHWE